MKYIGTNATTMISGAFTPTMPPLFSTMTT